MRGAVPNQRPHGLRLWSGVAFSNAPDDMALTAVPTHFDEIVTALSQGVCVVAISANT
jgi:hypothetical protein